MRALRLGSYSMAATRPGTSSLSRLKSMTRYRRLVPPPRWRAVMTPRWLRPPLFLRRWVSAFSGSVFVISAPMETDPKRRPAEVGLYFLIAIRLPSPASHPTGRAGCAGLAGLERLAEEAAHHLAFAQGDDRLLHARGPAGAAPCLAELALDV